MIKRKQTILIACDSSKSLIDFRGKLIEEMVRQHVVHVFTPRISHRYISEKLASLHVIVHENGLKGSNVTVFSDIRYIVALYGLMRKVRPDIFFPYTFKPVIYGTLLAKLCGIKKITPMLTGLGYTFSERPGRDFTGAVTRRLLRISLKKNNGLRVILQNRDDYLTLRKHDIITRGQKVYIVNGSGVDPDYYTYSPPDVKHISFIMIARLINAKGINEYYEAARNILLKYPHTEFKLIGAYDDNIDAISLELFKKITSGDIIHYFGEVTDVRPYIRESAVVVLPSYYGEGVPRSLLESMAMGRAIITSDSVGCRETVENIHATNGFLVPVKNVAELTSKMEFYLKHPASVIAYGLNGLALAHRKFNVHYINEQMLKIMQLN